MSKWLAIVENKIPELRNAYTAGETRASLSARFNISQPTVSQIIRRVTWTHVL